MRDFYEQWLELWDRGAEERRTSRKAIYPEELQWVKTRQDYRAALLVAPETGFKTLGGVTMLAEIPVSWKTGRHNHGEEAIHILKGKGFTVMNDRRFDWEEGACIRIPFGSIHQHFNDGDTPVQYFAALAPHLEHFCSVAKFQHQEDCGENTSIPRYDKAGSDYDEQGRRIVLHRKDALVRERGEDDVRLQDAFRASTHPRMQTVQHGKIIRLMGASEDFRGDEVEITDIFVERPRTSSQKHAHMEALLYVIQGEGHTVIDGQKVPWRPGTALHIQGPQTVHQHFNTGSVESHHLRTHFGIRKYIQPIAKEVFPYLFFEEGKQL